MPARPSTPIFTDSGSSSRLPALVCKQPPLQALVLGLDPLYRALVLTQGPIHRVQDVAHCGFEDLVQRRLQEEFQILRLGHVGPSGCGCRRLGAAKHRSKYRGQKTQIRWVCAVGTDAVLPCTEQTKRGRAQENDGEGRRGCLAAAACSAQRPQRCGAVLQLSQQAPTDEMLL